MGSRSDRYDEEDVNWSGEVGINLQGEMGIGSGKYDEDEVNWTGEVGISRVR